MKPCGHGGWILFLVTVNRNFGKVMPQLIYIPINFADQRSFALCLSFFGARSN
jgi:hypothetical protein